MMSGKYRGGMDFSRCKSVVLLSESYKWIVMLISLLFIFGMDAFSGDFPTAISYQGVAVYNNTERAPLVEGTHSVTLRIKDAAKSGKILWGRKMDVKVGKRGFFNIVLTDPDLADPTEVDVLAPTNTLSSVFTGYDASQRFLSFNVNGHEFTPLQQFNTTPYAVKALSAWHALGNFDVYGSLKCSIGTDASALVTINTNVQIAAQLEIEKGAVLTCMNGVNVGGDFISSNNIPSFAGAVRFNDSLVCVGDLQAANLRTKALKINDGSLEPQSTTLFSSYEQLLSGHEGTTGGGVFMDNSVVGSVAIPPIQTDSLLLVVHSFKKDGSVQFVVMNYANNKIYDASAFTEKNCYFRHTSLIPVPGGASVTMSLGAKGTSQVTSVYRVKMGRDINSEWNFYQPAPALAVQSAESVPDALAAQPGVSPLASGVPVGDAELDDPIIPDSMACQCVLKGENNISITNSSVKVDIIVFSDNSDNAVELWHKTGVSAYANEYGLVTIILEGKDDTGRNWHQAFIADDVDQVGRYLGIKLVCINDDADLKNITVVKQRLVAAPYAFAAEQIAKADGNFYVAGALHVDGAADLGGLTASNVVVTGSAHIGAFLGNRGTLEIRGTNFNVSGCATFHKGVTMKESVTVKNNLYAQAKSTLTNVCVGVGGFFAETTSLWEDDSADGEDGTQKPYGWACLDDTPKIHKTFDLRTSFGQGDGFFMIRARMDYMEHFWFILSVDGVDKISDICMGADTGSKFSTVMTIPVPAAYNLKFNRASKVESCEVFWLPLRRQ